MKKIINTIAEIITAKVKVAWFEIVATGKATAKTIVKTLNGILYEVTAKPDTNGNIAIHNLAIQGLLFNI